MASQVLLGLKVLPVLKVPLGQPAPMVSKGHPDQPEMTANLGLRVSRDQKALRVLRERTVHPRLRWLTPPP